MRLLPLSSRPEVATAMVVSRYWVPFRFMSSGRVSFSTSCTLPLALSVVPLLV